MGQRNTGLGAKICEMGRRSVGVYEATNRKVAAGSKGLPVAPNSESKDWCSSGRTILTIVHFVYRLRAIVLIVALV